MPIIEPIGQDAEFHDSRLGEHTFNLRGVGAVDADFDPVVPGLFDFRQAQQPLLNRSGDFFQRNLRRRRISFWVDGMAKK